jgi:peptide/nickel transport system permease protein
LGERLAKLKAQTRHSFFVNLIIRLVKEKPLGTVGAVIVLAMLLVGILANVLAPHGVNETDLASAISPPSPQHWLGTDNVGRDLLTRIIFGARVSMIVGLAGAGLSVLISTIIGITSGFLGGTVDLVTQRIVDAWMCFPALFIILTVMSILGPGLLQVIIVLATSGGIVGSRIVRSAVIAIKENLYVQAATAIGCSSTRILTKHILPSVSAPMIILFTVSMGGMILAEATISFLGYGIPPPLPSWGGMLSGAGRDYMLQAPWMSVWPGLALGIVVYGINMLGDALRDILDPRLRGGLGRYGRSKIKIARRKAQKRST